ncbi:MAG: methyltransferase domain-containing protein [Acidobacteria bacterium]|nr:methyltransferase domain-containing protein [Acidobacteriota bacterium]
MVRSIIYDTLVAPLTASWYREVLQRLSPGSRLLDIGIGTGAALSRNAELVRSAGIHVTGLDIDPEYVDRCRSRVRARGLADRVQVHLRSVYDHEEGGFAAAYFSASFMLLPDPPGALRHVQRLLDPPGMVYFTQTFNEHRSKTLEALKPHLHRLTTVRFGRVTYPHEFFAVLTGAGLTVTETLRLKSGLGGAARLIVARAQADSSSAVAS